MVPEKDTAVGYDDPATLERRVSSHEEAQGQTAAQKSELPVDGGLECWLQVVGSFALWLNTWGIINSFGQFQTYYETVLADSPGRISWIGSTQTFLLFFIGILNAPLMDAGYSRQLVVVGNLFVVFGLMMTSISHQYWHFMLAQGVTCGLGFGLLFLPSLSILVQYFVKKRAFAITIAATGSGIGGTIYPIMLRRLIPDIGFPWAVRTIAFMSLAFAMVSIAIVRSRARKAVKPEGAAPAFFRNPALLAFTAAYFFIFMGVYVPAIYLGSYALTEHVASATLAFYLLPTMMAASAVGRLGLGYLADHLGVLNLAIFASFATCLLSGAWIAIRDTSGAFIFSAIYGIFLGTVVSLPSPGIALLVTSMEMFNTHLGMVSLIASFGVLIGPPIAGACLDSTMGFEGLQIFATCILGTAGCFLVLARGLKTGWQWSRI